MCLRTGNRRADEILDENKLLKKAGKYGSVERKGRWSEPLPGRPTRPSLRCDYRKQFWMRADAGGITRELRVR